MAVWRGAVAAAVIIGWASAAPAQSLDVQFRGSALLANETTDQHGASFTITGLSGITYTGGNSFLAVMDNSSNVITLEVSFNADGSIASAAVPGGLSLSQSADFEAIAYTNPERNSIFLAEEGTPAVHEFALADGQAVRELPRPAVFGNRRPNLGFESLTLRSDGREMWTGNEEALTVDGDRSNVDSGSTVRLLRYVLDGGDFVPVEQYAYVTDPIHKEHNDANRAFSRSGLVELVVLPDGKLLALERSFALAGVANLASDFRNAIYEIDLTGATDISGDPFAAGLDGRDLVPATKHLLWSYTGLGIGNLEGLALGPQLPNGNWTLVGIVDDGDPASMNRLITFELIIPEPAGALGAVGATMLLMLRVREATIGGAAHTGDEAAAGPITPSTGISPGG